MEINKNIQKTPIPQLQLQELNQNKHIQQQQNPPRNHRCHKPNRSSIGLVISNNNLSINKYNSSSPTQSQFYQSQQSQMYQSQVQSQQASRQQQSSIGERRQQQYWKSSNSIKDQTYYSCNKGNMQKLVKRTQSQQDQTRKDLRKTKMNLNLQLSDKILQQSHSLFNTRRNINNKSFNQSQTNIKSSFDNYLEIKKYQNNLSKTFQLESQQQPREKELRNKVSLQTYLKQREKSKDDQKQMEKQMINTMENSLYKSDKIHLKEIVQKQNNLISRNVSREKSRKNSTRIIQQLQPQQQDNSIQTQNKNQNQNDGIIDNIYQLSESDFPIQKTESKIGSSSSPCNKNGQIRLKMESFQYNTNLYDNDLLQQEAKDKFNNIVRRKREKSGTFNTSIYQQDEVDEEDQYYSMNNSLMNKSKQQQKQKKQLENQFEQNLEKIRQVFQKNQQQQEQQSQTQQYQINLMNSQDNIITNNNNRNQWQHTNMNSKRNAVQIRNPNEIIEKIQEYQSKHSYNFEINIENNKELEEQRQLQKYISNLKSDSLKRIIKLSKEEKDCNQEEDHKNGHNSNNTNSNKDQINLANNFVAKKFLQGFQFKPIIAQKHPDNNSQQNNNLLNPDININNYNITAHSAQNSSRQLYHKNNQINQLKPISSQQQLNNYKNNSKLFNSSVFQQKNSHINNNNDDCDEDYDSNSGSSEGSVQFQQNNLDDHIPKQKNLNSILQKINTQQNKELQQQHFRQSSIDQKLKQKSKQQFKNQKASLQKLNTSGLSFSIKFDQNMPPFLQGAQSVRQQRMVNAQQHQKPVLMPKKTLDNLESELDTIIEQVTNQICFFNVIKKEMEKSKLIKREIQQVFNKFVREVLFQFNNNNNNTSTLHTQISNNQEPKNQNQQENNNNISIQQQQYIDEDQFEGRSIRLSAKIFRYMMVNLRQVLNSRQYEQEYIQKIIETIHRKRWKIQEGNILQGLGGTSVLVQVLSGVVKDLKKLTTKQFIQQIDESKLFTLFFINFVKALSEKQKELDIQFFFENTHTFKIDFEDFFLVKFLFFIHLKKAKCEFKYTMLAIQELEKYRYIICVYMFLEFKRRDPEKRKHIMQRTEWNVCQNPLIQQIFSKDVQLQQEFCECLTQYVIFREDHPLINLVIFIEQLQFTEFQWLIVIQGVVKVCEEENFRPDFVEDAKMKLISLGYKCLILKNPLKIMGGPQKIKEIIVQMDHIMENDDIQFNEYKEKYPEEQKFLKYPNQTISDTQNNHNSYENYNNQNNNNENNNNDDLEPQYYEGLAVLEMQLLNLLGEYDCYAQWDWKGCAVGLHMADHVLIQWKTALQLVLEQDFKKQQQQSLSLSQSQSQHQKQSFQYQNVIDFLARQILSVYGSLQKEILLYEWGLLNKKEPLVIFNSSNNE